MSEEYKSSELSNQASPPKRRNCFDFLEFKTAKLWRKSRKIIKKIFLIMWEIFYYGLIFMVATVQYGDYGEQETPFWIFSVVFFYAIVAHKGGKVAYRNFEQCAKYDEFYKRFIHLYKLPLLFPQLLLIFLFAKYCSVGTFLILVVFLLHSDTCARRYYENHVMQDLILEELKKKTK